MRRHSRLRTVAHLGPCLWLTFLIGTALVRAQTASTATTDTASSTSSASSTTSTDSSGNTTCSYSGSVTDYLSCEKSKISTTTLIVAGLGVVLGIFLLAGGIVWLSNRRRAVRAAKAPGTEEGMRRGQRNHGRRLEGEEEEEEGGEEQEQEVFPEKMRREREKPAVRREESPRAAKVTDEDEEEERMVERPSSLSAKTSSAWTQRQQSSNSNLHLGTPIDPAQPRPLYPVNPSPNPRHLQSARTVHPPSPNTALPTAASSSALPRAPGPPPAGAPPKAPSAAAMRQSAYTRRRDSMASVHFSSSAAPASARPPVPVQARPIEGGTKPLAIRKSVASVALPSYYETPSEPLPTGSAQRAPVSRGSPESRASSRQSVRRPSGGTTASNQSAESQRPLVPPLPPQTLAPIPAGERRPSAATAGSVGSAAGPKRPTTGRRPSERGQMI